jgi:23S rRNA A2030 N6-methylase RlmJ
VHPTLPRLPRAAAARDHPGRHQALDGVIEVQLDARMPLFAGSPAVANQSLRNADAKHRPMLRSRDSKVV